MAVVRPQPLIGAAPVRACDARARPRPGMVDLKKLRGRRLRDRVRTSCRISCRCSSSSVDQRRSGSRPAGQPGNFAALAERLGRRTSAIRRVFDALVAMSRKRRGGEPDRGTAEGPDPDPMDLAASMPHGRTRRSSSATARRTGRLRPRNLIAGFALPARGQVRAVTLSGRQGDDATLNSIVLAGTIISAPCVPVGSWVGSIASSTPGAPAPACCAAAS